MLNEELLTDADPNEAYSIIRADRTNAEEEVFALYS